MSSEKAYLSLSEVQELISESISERFREQFWLTAEISEIKINYSGHCYLELVEKGEGKEDITARVRAIIWSRQARFILPYFETTTGSNLSEGMKILIKAGVEYHKLYGLSLVISDIDPAYTIGEIAVRRSIVLKKLQEEGVAEMNRELEFPLFPGRIAVISSETAAGYTDFRDQLAGNSYLYNFQVTLFPAVMQGKETSASVRSAMNSIFEKIEMYDIVVIVRGGGSQADLSWFDDYEIAYMITQFPVPVLTGIGHEKDISVSDMVAYSYLKTPTAVADYIIERTNDTELYLESLGRRISERAGQMIRDLDNSVNNQMGRLKPAVNTAVSKNNQLLAKHSLKIQSAARIMIIHHNNRLRHATINIKPASKRMLDLFAARINIASITFRSSPLKLLTENLVLIENIEKAVGYLSPESVIKRGYSITKLNGLIIKDISQIKKGDRVTTIIHKGKFESEVFDIN